MLHFVSMRCYSVVLVTVRVQERVPEFLVLRRKGGTLDGSWCLITGCIELGETAWKAGIRELQEEAGLSPIDFYSADTCDQFYDPHREILSIIPAFVAFVAASDQVCLDTEHSDFRWCTLEDAKALVAFGGQRDLLDFANREFIERPPLKTLKIELQAVPDSSFPAR